MGSSVASFLVLGGGGGASPPNVPTEQIVTYMRERAPQKTYILRSQNTSAYIQSMQFPFITYGMALYTTV